MDGFNGFLHAFVAQSHECEEGVLAFVLSSKVVETKHEEQQLTSCGCRKTLVSASLGSQAPARLLLICQQWLHRALDLLARYDELFLVTAKIFKGLFPDGIGLMCSACLCCLKGRSQICFGGFAKRGEAAEFSDDALFKSLDCSTCRQCRAVEFVGLTNRLRDDGRRR